MEYLIQLFGAIPLSTVIIFIAAIAFVIYIANKVYNFIIDKHDKKQAKDESLSQVASDIKEMKESQKDLTKSMEEVIKSQKKLSKRQDEIEAETKKYRMNSLRDRLYQSYRYYTNTNHNPNLAWTALEKEAFDKLFEEYEVNGGNGQMHDTVKPAMDKLDVIPMSDMKAITELMISRKG